MSPQLENHLALQGGLLSNPFLSMGTEAQGWGGRTQMRSVAEPVSLSEPLVALVHGGSRGRGAWLAPA